MKFKFLCLILITVLIPFNYSIYSQEDKEEFEPVFITVTTLHGVNGVDLEEWIKVEREYFNKVTSKLNLLLSHEVLVSYFSRNLREVKVINIIKNWDDIDKVNRQREELIAKSWPDEAKRDEFFKKQNSFYTNMHSDEIYISTRNRKELAENLKKDKETPLVYLVKTNYLSDNDDIKSDEAYLEFVDNVIKKNKLIKGYYPYRHFWGADSREFVEVYVVESLTDLEKALIKNKKLLKKFIPEDDKRKEFLKIFDLAIGGTASDIYINIPSLSK